jgi:hypothetical protein
VKRRHQVRRILRRPRAEESDHRHRCHVRKRQ